MPEFEHWRKDLLDIGVSVATLDEYDEIETLLRQLVVRCRPRRLFVSGSPPGEKRLFGFERGVGVAVAVAGVREWWVGGLQNRG